MELFTVNVSSITVILSLAVTSLLAMSLFDFIPFGKSKFIVDGRVRIVNQSSKTTHSCPDRQSYLLEGPRVWASRSVEY